MVAFKTEMVKFYGDELEAVKDDAGSVFVGLRRCCESIGVSAQMQHKKLKTCSWATVMQIITVAQDGRRREVAVISLDSLPMWLATINERKVLPHVREKLVRYQREAAKVLAAHFFPKPSIPVAPPPPQISQSQRSLNDVANPPNTGDAQLDVIEMLRRARTSEMKTALAWKELYSVLRFHYGDQHQTSFISRCPHCGQMPAEASEHPC